MKKTKIVAMLLAAVLSIGTVSVSLSSCNDESGKVGETNKNENLEVFDDGLVLPKNVSGNGEDFDVFIVYNTADQDFIATEETGDSINDIIYRRNQEVASSFNVNFNFRAGDSDGATATPVIRSLIQGGDDTYEVFINVQHAGLPLIYDDLFVDWNTSMRYVNLDNPWWYKKATDDLNFGGKVFIAAGAYNYQCLRSMMCLVFNKDILDEVGLDYPYEMVKNGTWTIDRLIEYSKASQKDLNGDGAIDHENDRLGVAGWGWEFVPGLFVGLGGKSVTKDEYDMPSLSVNDERTFLVVDKMLELLSSGTGAWANFVRYGWNTDNFMENKLVFDSATLAGLGAVRSMESDCGIVPFPKLNEEQEEYHARIVNFAGLTYIPVTNTKLDLTSAVLEYSAYLSYKELIPEFYDIILDVKTARDVETEEMVDIVRDSATFMDENYLSTSNLIGFVNSGNNTLASSYAGRQSLTISLISG